MDEIKNIFAKHIGFVPDIISTTEHAYISPPSRVVSSLYKLRDISRNKKVLRVIMSDTFSLHKEKNCTQLCIPMISSCTYFDKDEMFFDSESRIVSEFYNQIDTSGEYNKRFNVLLNQYKSICNAHTDNVDRYVKIINFFLNELELYDLALYNMSIPYIDILSVELFEIIRESFNYLYENNADILSVFGRWMEKRNRLKYKDSNGIKNISWNEYIFFIKNKEYKNINMPFENLLLLASFCNIDHYGNDYWYVNFINQMSKCSATQLTAHNEDFYVSIKEENVVFYTNIVRNKKNIFKKNHTGTVDTLPELFILKGSHFLINAFKE